MSQRPVVYLFHGEDEYNIALEIDKFKERMGEASMVNMNTMRFDGRRLSLPELQNAVSALPFLLERRLVILEQPCAQMKTKADQEQFIKVLDQAPDSTALILVEKQELKPEHWLMKWAARAGGRAYVKAMLLPKGAQMRDWIRKQAHLKGGEILPDAAAILAEQVLEDPRTASQEIEKLLAFVGYRRPVEVDDVQMVTPAMQQANVFKMVDALGTRNTQAALKMLHTLLDEQEPNMIFGMIVRQFRLLLQAKDLLDAGLAPFEIARTLHIQDFVARNLITQCNHFTFDELKTIHRQLLNIDEQVKSSLVSYETALDTLVVSLAPRSTGSLR